MSSSATGPSIACIGIIGKQDNPLHISLFPPHTSVSGSHLEFSFLLNASLDIFDLRSRDKNRVDQDLGLLHAVDERLSIWGWETGTGTRFAIVLDMWGRDGMQSAALGVKEGELRPAFRSLQTAWIRLLMDPFFVPDEWGVAVGRKEGEGEESVEGGRGGRGGRGISGRGRGMIRNRRFVKEVERIGMSWRSGVGAV